VFSSVDCIVSDWHATRLPRKISIDVDGNQGLYQHFAPDVVEASSFSFQFEAQSTCDLYIAIMKSKTEQSSSAFEIVLGGASGGSQAQSMIRYGTHAEALVVASGQTVQSSFSHYWVR
jgi:hypothetical protein